MPLALYHSHVRQYRDMVSDQAVSHLPIPHEGRCRLSLSPSIVGLSRNNLSEVVRLRLTATMPALGVSSSLPLLRCRDSPRYYSD